MAASAATVAPRPAAAAPWKLTQEERLWVTAAEAFTRDIEERVALASAGGSDLASASRALHDTSHLYATLVAYTYFDSCSTILHNLGIPSLRLLPPARRLARACRAFEQASSLFEAAVQRDDPESLLAASRASLNAFAPVAAVRTWLQLRTA